MADQAQTIQDTDLAADNINQEQPTQEADGKPEEAESNQESPPEETGNTTESQVDGEPQQAEAAVSEGQDAPQDAPQDAGDTGAGDKQPSNDETSNEGTAANVDATEVSEKVAENNADDAPTTEATVDGETPAAGNADPLDDAEQTAASTEPQGDEAQEADALQDSNKDDQPAGQPGADGGDAAEPEKEGDEAEGDRTEPAEATEVQPGEEGNDKEAVNEGNDKEAVNEGQENEAAEKTEENAMTENEDGTQAVTENEDAEGEGTRAPDDQNNKDETEKPQSPTIEVSEKLSRGGTPTADAEPGGDGRTESPPKPDSPHPDEYDDDAILEQEELEDEEPLFDREQLIEQYHEAIAMREQVRQKNNQMQHKLADYFRKKQSDENRTEGDINVTDQEQRYLKYMANLEELRHHDAIQRKNYKEQIEELNERTEEKKDAVSEEQHKFTEFKKQVALNAINTRSGKPIPQKDIDAFLAAEIKKDGVVFNVRLENIKLKNKLRKKETQLKLKEELAEGLHLIDFEQLKIENQTYNEKIEERNEELLKLKKKITTTVEVLTHVKEKLQFVQAENQVTKAQLREVEEEVAKKRDKLTRTKQARDQLRIDNHRLRQNCGLLGNEHLLRDYEDRKNESDHLRQKLEDLKMLHSELTVTCNGVRKKIDQAKVSR